MSDAFLVEHCAPTFAGLKTGNLFRISYADIEAFREELRELNGILKKKGLRAVPVRMTAEFALVYLYRPDFLREISAAKRQHVFLHLSAMSPRA